MELTYQLSKNDYLRFYKLSLIDSFYKQFGRFLIFTIALVVVVNLGTFKWWWLLTSIVAIPALVVIIYYVIPLLIYSTRLNKIIASTPSVLKERSLTLAEDGLRTTVDDKTSTWKWESMKSASSNAEFVYVFLVDGKFIAMPKRCFESGSDATNFYGLILKEIDSRALMPKFHLERSPPKPNYWWGLLGLIPIVGGVAGLIFTLNGISRYKDAKYILMGIACMSFTLGVAYFAERNLKLEQLFDSGFIVNSHFQLNDLMKDVEFYKLRHGQYPDSLAQLSKDGPMISNFDPIQSSHSKYGTGYNYKKVGNHYYLFSSGLDGVPNTKDDFHPDVAVTDSAKFGLIRN
ncbi:MAG: YcxB family protein [Mucilaginibacter sp.]